MNERIENCLAKELAHIFSVFNGPAWPKGLDDYDDRVRHVRIELRKGNGSEYLTRLNEILHDENTNYKDFHKFYIRGIQELLQQSIKHKVLEGPYNNIPKVDHSHDNDNVFTLDINKDSLERLDHFNKTNMRYYNVLKYGIDRIQQDLRKYYPDATVCLSRDYHSPDFMRDPYIYHGVKYMIFWPLMPTVLLWNGYPGTINHGPSGIEKK